MKSRSQYFVVVRHGQTEANVLTSQPTNEHYYLVAGSDKTLNLTPLGQLQSEFSARRIASWFPPQMPLAEIIHSAFLRTHVVAAMIGAKLPYPVKIFADARVDKRSYGDFWNITYAGVEALHPTEHALFVQQGAFHYRPPNGENYPELIARVGKFLDERVYSSCGNICVVTHSAVVLVIEQFMTGLSNEELLARYHANHVENGELVVYFRRSRNAAWRRCPLWWYRLQCAVAAIPLFRRAFKKVA